MVRSGAIAVALAVASVAVGPLASARPAAAAPAAMGGCAYKEMCLVDGDAIVLAAVGDRRAYPAGADDRADRVINNGSAFDLVLYQHAAGDTATGWALCVPKGQVVGLAGLKPAVHDQASSHTWVAGGHCNGKVGWLRAPGASSAPSAGTSPSAVPAMAARSVEIARSQLGVREVPENRGSRVLEYQKSVRNDNLSVRQAWCASFLTWVFLQAGDPTPFRSSLVVEWVRAATRGRSGMSLVSARDVRVGDLVAFKAGGFWHHMGIVSSVRNGVTVLSGNTSAADKKADGIFEKPLSNWTSKGYAATFLRNAG